MYIEEYIYIMIQISMIFCSVGIIFRRLLSAIISSEIHSQWPYFMLCQSNKEMAEFSIEFIISIRYLSCQLKVLWVFHSWVFGRLADSGGCPRLLSRSQVQVEACAETWCWKQLSWYTLHSIVQHYAKKTFYLSLIAAVAGTKNCYRI